MSDSSADDRRQHERFELLAQVAVHRGGDGGTVTVINISAGGVLLRNDPHLQVVVGEGIRVTFDVAQLSLAFAIDAKIVRVIEATSKPPALAAMWTSSDATATAALAQLLWSLKQS